MTRAPRCTAQRMASASARSGIVPSAATTLATMSWEEYARPTTPASFSAPAISPATIVPCPWLSMHGLPPTKLFEAATWLAKSGSAQSTPESMSATLTGCRGGGAVGQASNAWSCSRYHCFG